MPLPSIPRHVADQTAAEIRDAFAAVWPPPATVVVAVEWAVPDFPVYFVTVTRKGGSEGRTMLQEPVTPEVVSARVGDLMANWVLADETLLKAQADAREVEG